MSSFKFPVKHYIWEGQANLEGLYCRDIEDKCTTIWYKHWIKYFVDDFVWPVSANCGW